MTQTDAQADITRDVRIEAARLKLELDKKLHRDPSPLAERLAAEKTSDERRAG
ncbi:hypothetical protein [Mycobacteroides abscessus]|uniref:Uncharacterized protein n=1 Tax=Mycobacteroides abscessus subsp. bolletii CRM-0020 TaxID=1306401 RepID=A0A829HLU2_9MYCO|nr:hypothetical protein [Mycobacteroides abscessus]EPQ20987.1 hypothetical protein J108_23530 [Mycobacteroides abscessus subsp. bolletii CRM-0020]MBN7488211.1 hypothetical protein [Mycobacteroides abscessus subsp. abscessus]SHY46269.1 Uncharacterised protein [Mycobacteroides abscessus subsp. abscessus]SIA43468.1 Uncharacterised protein [Mycobacteroides abscessus subsp. abscessus]SIA55605.1 Uncharacterised protein [Mycobacteroides abscessus subsp. abscessus]